MSRDASAWNKHTSEYKDLSTKRMWWAARPEAPYRIGNFFYTWVMRQDTCSQSCMTRAIGDAAHSNQRKKKSLTTLITDSAQNIDFILHWSRTRVGRNESQLLCHIAPLWQESVWSVRMESREWIESMELPVRTQCT